MSLRTKCSSASLGLLILPTMARRASAREACTELCGGFSVAFLACGSELLVLVDLRGGLHVGGLLAELADLAFLVAGLPLDLR
jgi:hypothetical protein